MHTTSITTALLATALLSSAIPTGTSDLVPRSCTTEYPSLVDHIYEVTPDYANQQTDYFELALDTAVGGSPRLYPRDVIVQFDNIPANSYGCQLEAHFPVGGHVEQHGASQVNVFTVDKPATPADTWNTAPQPVSLFGTLTFAASGTEAVTTVINSGVCNETLTYRFSIASATQIGEVYFQQAPGAAGQSLRLTHNC